MKRVCPVCGGEFETLTMNRKYCSKECVHKHKLEYDKKRRESYRAERVPINCEICGREFMPRRKDHKYCSKECAKIARTTYQRDYRRSQASENMKERCLIARRYEKLSVIICPSCTFDHCIHDK